MASILSTQYIQKLAQLKHTTFWLPLVKRREWQVDNSHLNKSAWNRLQLNNAAKGTNTSNNNPLLVQPLQHSYIGSSIFENQYLDDPLFIGVHVAYFNPEKCNQWSTDRPYTPEPEIPCASPEESSTFTLKIPRVKLIMALQVFPLKMWHKYQGMFTAMSANMDDGKESKYVDRTHSKQTCIHLT